MTNEINSEKLFSYGTLRYEQVQLKTFGRLLTGNPDKLVGYKLSTVAITDSHVIALSGETVHSILIPTGSSNDTVDGMVFEVSAYEIILADSYEVSDYKRVSATLHSGSDAWVYISKDFE